MCYIVPAFVNKATFLPGKDTACQGLFKQSDDDFLFFFTFFLFYDRLQNIFLQKANITTQIEYFSKINGKVALVHIMCDICSPFAGRQRG